MASRDNRTSQRLATNIPIRGNPQAIGNTETSHAQRTDSNTTQSTRLSSNNESGRLGNNHVHSINGQVSSPTTGLQTQTTGALARSISTTHAIPSESARRPSNSDSIELDENPEHPHACAMKKDLQELTKPFDRNDEKQSKYWNGQA